MKKRNKNNYYIWYPLTEIKQGETLDLHVHAWSRFIHNISQTCCIGCVNIARYYYVTTIKHMICK